MDTHNLPLAYVTVCHLERFISQIQGDHETVWRHFEPYCLYDTHLPV
jgi:hypothetical protein